MRRKRISGVLVAALLASPAWALADGSELFRPPAVSMMRMSPDGSHLAIAVNDGGHQRIDSLHIPDQSRTAVFATSVLEAEEVTITNLEWVDDNTLAVFVSEFTEGVASLSDTRNVRRLFVVDIDDPETRLRYVRTSGTLISARPAVPDEILFGISGSRSFVYRVDTSKLGEWGKPLGKTALPDGGQFSRKRRLAEVDGFVIGWIADVRGQVRGALRFKPEEGIALLLRADDSAEWREERAWELKKKRRSRRAEPEEDEVIHRPVAIIEGSSDFVIVADDESGRDAVYRYNYGSDEKTLIYQHATAEIVDVDLSHDGSEVLSVTYYEDGVVKQQFLDGQYEQVASGLQAKFPAYSAHIASVDTDGSRFVIFLSSSAQPGRVLVSNDAADDVKELFSIAPWLEESQLARSVAGRTGSGGLDVEYYLTLPDGSAPAPLVVYPHGGPWGVRDYRNYHPTVQYLARRGFAVLQVNFRGSGGYGQAFVDSGDGEFGKGMLEDIEAAISAVSGNRRVDAERACAVGQSYGGYASLMLAVRSPERFRCAASFAGPTDIGLLLSGLESEAAAALLEKITGDTSPYADQYDTLRQISPLYLAGQVTVPVLLAHGDEDRRVDIEHAYRMKMRLVQLGKSVTWLEYEGQEHGLDSPELHFEYSRILADFVAEHTASR